MEVSAGKRKSAKKTQKEQLKYLNGVVNGVPVVGHVKGFIHYALGDKKGCNHCMEAASRSTAVVGGAVLGSAGGPVGAAAGAAAAGVAADGVATGIASAKHQKWRGHGAWALISAARDAPGREKAGHIFDAISAILGDALAGYAVGEVLEAKKYTARPVNDSKFSTEFQGEKIELVSMEKEGAAKVYVHDTMTDFDMNMQVLQDMSQAHPDSQIHVAAGCHGAPAQCCFTSNMAPDWVHEPTFYTDYSIWRGADRPANLVVYDMTSASGVTQFKAAMKTPGNVCYIDWCYGVDSPALNPNPATVAKIAAVQTAAVLVEQCPEDLRA